MRSTRQLFLLLILAHGAVMAQDAAGSRSAIGVMEPKSPFDALIDAAASASAAQGESSARQAGPAAQRPRPAASVPDSRERLLQELESSSDDARSAALRERLRLMDANSAAPQDVKERDAAEVTKMIEAAEAKSKSADGDRGGDSSRGPSRDEGDTSALRELVQWIRANRGWLLLFSLTALGVILLASTALRSQGQRGGKLNRATGYESGRMGVEESLESTTEATPDSSATRSARRHRRRRP